MKLDLPTVEGIDLDGTSPESETTNAPDTNGTTSHETEL